MKKVDLYQGDCLECMKQLSDKSIDMILSDLPYGMTRCPWDVEIPFEPLWEQYLRIIKPSGVIALFGAEPFSSRLRLSNIKMYKYDWVWDKIRGTGFLNAKKQPLRCHENISVFYKGQCYYNPQKTTGHPVKKAFRRAGSIKTPTYGKMEKDVYYESTERYPRSIQAFSSDAQSTLSQPAQKPVNLLSYLIKTYTKPDETVLDNCMGTGSTGVACLVTGRKFIGMEIDPEKFALAEKRISDMDAVLCGGDEIATHTGGDGSE